MLIVGIDTSGLGNDYTAIVAIEVCEKLKVIGVWQNKQDGLNDRLIKIKHHLEMMQPNVVYVESNNMGIFYINELSKHFNVVSVATTKKSKPRMLDLIKFYLERNLLDLTCVKQTELITQMKEYPYCKHDDLFMALAVALYGNEVNNP